MGYILGLTVSLQVAPGAVGQDGEFDLTLTIANATGETIHIDTPHSCLALPHVMRGGQRVPFEGTAFGCHTALTTHVFPPGYESTTTFTLRATLYAEHAGDADGVAAPKGSYVVQMVFESAGRPTIGRTLQVY